MRRVLLVFAILGAAVGTARGQQSVETQITFYNGGSLWKNPIPGLRKAEFIGALFQDKQKLAGLYRPRFLTLRIAPGTYTFSASLSQSHPAKNSQMLLTVMPGSHYFVRVVTENAGGFGGSQGRLDLVPCDVAQKEAGKMKPLEAKWVDDGAIDRAVDGMTLPGCVSAPATP